MHLMCTSIVATHTTPKDLMIGPFQIIPQLSSATLKNAAGYYNRGLAYKAKGDETSASADFDRARKLKEPRKDEDLFKLE